MSLNYVTLALNLYDGMGNPIVFGSAQLAPNVQLVDTTNNMDITPAPITAQFGAVPGFSPSVRLIATDNPTLNPSGWAWTISFTGVPGNPAPISFFLPFSGGTNQLYSNLVPVTPAPPVLAYLPLPGGTATAGFVPVATGNGESSNWGSPTTGSLPLAGGTMAGWIAPAVVQLAQSGGNVAVNAATGNDFRLTLTASGWTISNPTNPVDGQRIDFQFAEDATGGRSVSWGSAYSFGLAGVPTLTATANAVDIIGFVYNASKAKWLFIGGVFGY